jgi:hypothetical protein
MSLHQKSEYQTPALLVALTNYGLETAAPSQLADAFRSGQFGGAKLLDRVALAKQLCTETGEPDINRIVFTDNTNRYTSYDGETSWNPYLRQADHAISAIHKLRVLVCV